MLREAGAAEVHFRVSSPPYRYPCFYGMDTGRRGELLAADLSVGEIRDYLGVDSLAYLDLDRLVRATARARRRRSAPRASPTSTRSRSSSQGDGLEARCSKSRPMVDLTVARDARDRRRRRGLTYAEAGVDIAAGEQAVELIKAPRPLDVPTRVSSAASAASAGSSTSVQLDYRDPILVSSTDGVGTKSVHRVDDWPLRHDRHRPRRHRRRHRRAGRRSAVLLRLPLDGPARSRRRRHDRGWRRRGVPPGRRGAARRRDVGAPAADGGRRVRPRRVRRGCGRAGRRCCRATSSIGDVLVGIASPGLRCNGYSLARRALLDRAGRSLDEPAWPGADDDAGRRAAAPERDLRAGAGGACEPASRCTRSRTSPAAACRAIVNRVLPAGARCAHGPRALAGAADLRRGAARGRRRRRRDGVGVQPRCRHGRRGAAA